MPAQIDYHRCIGCKKCYDLCPLDVITWDKEMKLPKVTYEDECWHCGVCWAECPKRAINISYPACLW